MEKRLFALLLIIPLISTAITWYIFNIGNTEKNKAHFPKQNGQKKIPDTFFNHATIINFSEIGLPKSKIIGDQLYHYPDKEDSEIIKPIIILFRQKGSAINITADHGWMNQKGTRIILKGHTIIVREKSPDNHYFMLETPELTLFPDRDYAETDKHVKITTEGTVATGVGMKAYLDKEHYYLLNNVKGQHIPVKKTVNNLTDETSENL